VTNVHHEIHKTLHGYQIIQITVTSVPSNHRRKIISTSISWRQTTTSKH